MSQMTSLGTTFPVDRWLNFDGTATHVGNQVLLRPSIDDSIELFFASSDVQAFGNLVSVRQGARVRQIKIPNDSSIHKQPTVVTFNDCGSEGSMCVGRLEICCGSGKVVNSCAGFWPCR